MTPGGNLEERRCSAASPRKLRPCFSPRGPAMKGIPAHMSDTNSPRTRHDWPIYLLPALAAVGTRCLDVAILDLLFNALPALVQSRLPGLFRRPWPRSRGSVLAM